MNRGGIAKFRDQPQMPVAQYFDSWALLTFEARHALGFQENDRSRCGSVTLYNLFSQMSPVSRANITAGAGQDGQGHHLIDTVTGHLDVDSGVKNVR